MLAAGLELIARNFHCRFGEVDLIMSEADCLVFVEVRYRQSSQFASARQSVDRRKQLKLARTAAFFLSRKPGYANTSVRFDVLAIDRTAGQNTLEWIKDAFRPDF